MSEGDRNEIKTADIECFRPVAGYTALDKTEVERDIVEHAT
jgi:hypothetical protein